jgi:hypothetical protein
MHLPGTHDAFQRQMLAVSRFGVVMLSVAVAACTSDSVRSTPSDAPSGADAGSDASTIACASPQDCVIHLGAGPAVFCCIDHICILGQAAETEICDDPDAQVIQASKYDQACTTDSDCVEVGVGNFCYPGADNCPNAAINNGALSQYQADVAKTQAAVCGGLSGCPADIGPCCRQGTCQMGGACSSPADTLAACADAGGTCSPFVTQCGDNGAGPPDSCAYSDETCCLN